MLRSPLDRFTAGVTTAFAVAVLCAFPLYIDRFSNLGLTKFTGDFSVFLLFGFLIGACRLVGARAPRERFLSARRDVGLWALWAFVLVSIAATLTSLSPVSSLWGLGGYYGGLMMVLYTAVGYLCLRSYADFRDLDLLFLGVGASSSVVAVLYMLNIFNIDLIGAYADTAVVERAQFFSTLGQKNFNGGFFAVSLPIIFYAFLSAKGLRRSLIFAVPAFFGALALAVVDAEGLTLGIGVAAMVLVWHKDFNTRHLRRIALIGAAFFGWARWMYWMRRTVYTQGGTSIIAAFGRRELAWPCLAGCLLLWVVLLVLPRQLARRRGGEVQELPLWKPGRVLVVLVLAGAALLTLLANCWPGFPSLGRLDDLLIFNDDWGTYRGTAWRITWESWLSQPFWRKLLGVGPGMMHTAVLNWAGEAATARMKTFYAAHNEYLEQLLTTGLLGLAAWVTFAAAHLRRGFRHWNRPAVAPVMLALCSYLAQAAVSIRVSMIFPLVMLLFGLLAALTAPEPASLPQEAEAPRQGRHRRKGKKQADPPAPYWPHALRVAIGGVVGMAAGGALAPVLFWFLF